MKVANEVYFDATFKVVPGINYQLLTVFAPGGDWRHGVPSLVCTYDA